MSKKLLGGILQTTFTLVGTAIGNLVIPIPGVGAAIGAAVGTAVGSVVSSAAFPVRSPRPATAAIAKKEPIPVRLHAYGRSHQRGVAVPFMDPSA